MKVLSVTRLFLISCVLIGLMVVWSSTPMAMELAQELGACDEIGSCSTTKSYSCSTYFGEDCTGGAIACVSYSNNHPYTCWTDYSHSCYYSGTQNECGADNNWCDGSV